MRGFDRQPVIFAPNLTLQDWYFQAPCLQNNLLQNQSIFETIHGTTETPASRHAPGLPLADEVSSVRSATRCFRFRAEGVRR
jgi:hypothetical protein